MEDFQARQVVGFEKRARVEIEHFRHKSALGSGELAFTINSLAPFRGLSTGTTEAHRDLSQGNVLGSSGDRFFSSEAEYEQDLAWTQERSTSGLGTVARPVSTAYWSLSNRQVEECLLVDLHTSDSGTTVIASIHADRLGRFATQERQAIDAVYVIGTEQQSRSAASIASHIDLATGVESWAEAAGVSTEMRTVAALCLEQIPEARRVLVTLTADPEDRSEGLNFCVFTQASVEAVVQAEDELHEKLFQRVSSSKILSFSILYEFVE